MNTLIYTDNVSNNHILYYALGKLRGKNNVFFVNANEILAGALDEDVDLLVMPGGASRYKSDKLNGEGFQAIRDFVAGGGSYLGICAGAYLACEQTQWAKDTPFEIITPNQLDFFKGTAVGPIEDFGKGDNYNLTKARIVEIELNQQASSSLYLGGCHFVANNEVSGQETEYSVLARFTELNGAPPAMIHGEFGRGKWLLSSVHPEYDSEAIDLMRFDVVGNDYQDYRELPTERRLEFDALKSILAILCPDSD